MKGLDITGVCLIDDYVDQLMGLLEKGLFRHSADEAACPYCEFKYACYKDMRRMNYLVDSKAGHEIYSGKQNLNKWSGVDQFRKEWKSITLSRQKTFNLKTAAGRKRHFELVMDYGVWLRENRNSLPFRHEYIDELLGEIKDFEKKWSNLS